MLALGWSDGSSFLPFSCTRLSSISKEKNRLVPVRKDLDRRTNGAKRRWEAIRKATDALVDMVAEANATGIEANHLLFDNWFAYPAIMRKLLAKGMHTLCMLKVVAFERGIGNSLRNDQGSDSILDLLVSWGTPANLWCLMAT